MSKSDPYTPENQTRFTMRMETELLNKIKELASKNKRSTAKEIEYIIECYLASLDDPKES